MSRFYKVHQQEHNICLPYKQKNSFFLRKNNNILLFKNDYTKSKKSNIPIPRDQT